MTNSKIPRPKFKLGDVVIVHKINYPRILQGIVSKADFQCEAGEWRYQICNTIDTRDEQPVFLVNVKESEMMLLTNPLNKK